MQYGTQVRIMEQKDDTIGKKYVKCNKAYSLIIMHEH